MKINLEVWHPSATVAFERIGYKSGQVLDNSSMNDAANIIGNILACGLNVMVLQHNDNPDDPEVITIAVDTKTFRQR